MTYIAMAPVQGCMDRALTFVGSKQQGQVETGRSLIVTGKVMATSLFNAL